eukprot:TRINITY_DN15319_c0_g1_i1.p1 TRINITY_DN15319_c0_g1~~TRINITY_DN15319_c0_g1_i1.p1  ORF type:complete len:319 (+),score=133.84 TRINITY_DN15319_c0_g1_i1:71-1027(+)
MLKGTGMRLALGRITGLVSPPFTPYLPNGDVNFGAIPKQVEITAATGVSAVFLGGTGSEGASQTIDERMEIARIWKEQIAAQGANIKLISHVGATSLRESQELARRAEALGVDAVASVTPTFFKPGNLDQMVGWLRDLAAAAPETPFYYYHIPVITGVPPTISVKKFLEVGGPQIPSLHGVKYTSQNLCEYADLTDACGGKYDIMAGLSEQMLAALAMGAQSAVSVPFNLPFAMRYYHDVLQKFQAGDMAGALAVQKNINRLTYLLQFGGLGHGIPVMREMVKIETGLDLGPCRLPLTPLNSAGAEAVANALADLKLM